MRWPIVRIQIRIIDSNDCTNFISQVLEQGGISQTDDWYCRKESGDPCKWPSIFRDYFCEDGYKFKKSWTVVGDLYDHLIEKKIAKKCGLKDLQPGDLIQYNEKNLFWLEG